ncbi:MAG: 3-coathanger stack domain-containing protein [Bacteroidota bacterium]
MKGIFLSILGLTLFFLSSSAQPISREPRYLEMMKDPKNNNFFSIQNEFNNYFKGRDKGRGSGFNQFKRWESIAEPRFYPSGDIFNIEAKNLQSYQQYLDNFNVSSLPANYDPGNWISLGPSNHTLGSGWNGGIGRVSCIEFHPTDPNIYYVGTPAGGLWCKNGGTWTPLTDGISSLGVSAIAIEPDNADHIYILTGDGDAGHTNSIGILETWDGGLTWQATGLSWTISDVINGFRLLMDPTNHLVLIAATSDGVYKTTDGGLTWSKKLVGIIYDMEFKPGTPSTVYASSGWYFYRSINNGDTWAIITSGLPVYSNRMGLAVAPSNPNYVYLLYGHKNLGATQFPFVGCYLSTNGGSTFNLKSNTPNIFGYTTNGSDTADQCTYDLALVVNPILQSNVFFGGINCWRSTNSGLSWSHLSYWVEGTSGEQYTHADIHYMAFNPLNNYLYCCSDGGVYRSTDFGATWTDQSSGLEISQFYRIGMTPSNANLVVGGTQDNGCNTFDYSTGIYRHDRGADGFRCMIDYNNAAIRYAATYGSISRSSNAGSTFSFITPPIVNADIWNASFIMHPTTPSTLYLGHTDIWKTANSGTSWTAMGTGNTTSHFIQIAHGVNNTNRIYGVTGLAVYVTLNNGGIWSNVTGTLPVAEAQLSYVMVDPADAAHVWVTFSGYVDGKKVYYSSNSGLSWTNISGTLPNVSVNCINLEPGGNNGIYLGTDVGVFYKNNSLTDWVPFFNGLPNTKVTEMEINTANYLLTAGTFGRGLWRTPLYGHCASTYALTPANLQSSNSQQYLAASATITSTRTVYNSIGADVTYKAGSSVNLLPGFNTQNGVDFHAFIGPCAAVAMPMPAPAWDIRKRTSGVLKLYSKNTAPPY